MKHVCLNRAAVVFSAYRLQSLIGLCLSQNQQRQELHVFSAYRLQSLIGPSVRAGCATPRNDRLQRLSASVADRT